MFKRAIFWQWVVLPFCAGLLSFSCSSNPSGGDVDDDNEADNIPPRAIVDLRAVSVLTNSAVLEWTAPGDDSATDLAHSYDFRASLDVITEGNFSAAFQITDVDPPLPAGMTQTFTVDGLTPGETYYFAIKTRDEAGNWSGMSNCLDITCLVDEVIVFADTALERVIREYINLPTGDIHFSDVQDVTDLVAENENITSLSGLEYFVSLHWLIVPWNNISDLSPLEELTGLVTLNLIDNNVSDITPLANLTTLQQLHLGENPVTNIFALSNKTQLQWLRLNSTDVTDFSPIYSLPALVELDLSSNELSDISFVSNFTQVTVLWLGTNNISNLNPLSTLTQLSTLSLAFNNIVDVSPLASLTALQSLALPNNQIVDISALSNLENLLSLVLFSNQIVDIQPLVDNAGLGTGDQVYLQNNPLSAESISLIQDLIDRGVTVYH